MRNRVVVVTRRTRSIDNWQARRDYDCKHKTINDPRTWFVQKDDKPLSIADPSQEFVEFAWLVCEAS